MKRTTLAGLAGLAALPALGWVALGPLSAQNAEAPQDGGIAADLDRAEVEAIVHDYLMENPDVIVAALQRWQDAQALAAEADTEAAAREAIPALMAASSGVAMGAGPDEAEVLVAEFFDYHCGYCKRATDFVMDLAEEDGVRVVFQDLPILREESRGAALAGLAAAETGAYAEMHRQLMRAGGVLDEDAVAKAARRAGARDALGTLAQADARAALEAKLDASIDLARGMGLSGTPAFVIAAPDGGFVRVVPGYDKDAVRAAVEAARG